MTRLTQLQLPAPAKINLMLHITGRREDGYHELQTLFQFIDYADELGFVLREDAHFVRDAQDFKLDASEDIIIRSARALQSAYPVAVPGANIQLRKKIPMGAGLGGGSSDAATTLLALNRLWGDRLSIAELAEIGLQMGADVPVFIHGHAALGEGVGERLTPVDLPEPWYLVVVPQVHVSTKKVFAHPDLTRDCPSLKICDLLQTEWRNVFTDVVAVEYEPVSQAIEILGEFSAARMSGSGAAVFAECDDQSHAEQIRKKISENPKTAGWTILTARGMNRSPVHQQLGIAE